MCFDTQQANRLIESGRGRKQGKEKENEKFLFRLYLWTNRAGSNDTLPDLAVSEQRLIFRACVKTGKCMLKLYSWTNHVQSNDTLPDLEASEERVKSRACVRFDFP